MGKPSLFSPLFLIGEIRIGTISDASVMNLGNNEMSHFASHKKQNQGFGSITGDNHSIDNIRTLLNDPDFIDMLSDGKETTLPQWLEDMLTQQLKNKETDREDGDNP
ncbi:hypothetical protein GCM10011391_29680 [Pullulanibacillus camelliae]|uniref:Uncharacterized protein n=1 Tax=Pullulanibacillus camelliae TaxID=1707096 RepID=A0A8J3DXZ4_9BACL|nr:spore germination protein [Pullulanibacillus camelliae]GGE48910.1 hypothetical protein GCM10011391_29680 [Pullulanibacillus camelliae]